MIENVESENRQATELLEKYIINEKLVGLTDWGNLTTTLHFENGCELYFDMESKIMEIRVLKAQ